MKRKQRLPLPLELVREFNKDYPLCWEYVEYLREGKGKDLPDWNNLVYIPITGINEILRGKYNKSKGDVNISSLYAALASWRQYKEIYSFSDELKEVLFEQADEDIVIPIEILYQIPYPCIYISISETEGFFIFFEQDMNTMQMELRFCCIEENNGHIDIVNTWLHLEDGNTISDGIVDGMNLVKRNLKNLKYSLKIDESYIKQNEQEIFEYMYNLVSKYIQLVLYICAENAEIDENPIQKQVTRKPSKNSKPKDVCREIRSWDVGIKFANNVHRSRNYSTSSENIDIHYNGRNSPRPHTRRGHWHHYWVGSRSNNNRKLILKWTAPVFVGGDSDSNITTINKIK